MVMQDGQKWSCEPCIKGHRSANCVHPDRPLTLIQKKGRPRTCSTCRDVRKARHITGVKCVCNVNAADLPDAVHVPALHQASALPSAPRLAPYAVPQRTPSLKAIKREHTPEFSPAPSQPGGTQSIHQDAKSAFPISAISELPSMPILDYESTCIALAALIEAQASSYPPAPPSSVASEDYHLPFSTAVSVSTSCPSLTYTEPPSPHDPSYAIPTLEEMLAETINELPSVEEWSAVEPPHSATYGAWEALMSSVPSIPTATTASSEAWNEWPIEYGYISSSAGETSASASGSEYSFEAPLSGSEYSLDMAPPSILEWSEEKALFYESAGPTLEEALQRETGGLPV